VKAAKSGCLRKARAFRAANNHQPQKRRKIMAEVNTNSQADKVTDPKLLKVIARVAREMELSIEKVAANHARPTEFPLPDRPGSTEQILAARFKALPQEFKNKAGAKAMGRINAPAAVRKEHLEDLAAVNLKAGVAVGEQVSAMPMPEALKLTGADLTKITRAHVGVAAAAGANVALAGAGVGAILPGAIGATLPKLTRLEMRIHRVKCVDETGSGPFGDIGNDEIDLGGSAVDETGDVHTIAKFRVGSNFDSGEHVDFSPPRTFTTFDLREGTAFPKSYFVTLVLAEVDGGGLSSFIEKLVQKVKEKVRAALIKALGGAFGVSGGPVGVIIGVVAGDVINRVFDFIGGLWGDDVFTPLTTSVSIASLTARWPGGKTDSPQSVATFKGHGGHYRVAYDWRMRA
jgi:hypothetical protein